MPLRFGIQPSSPIPAYRQVISEVRNAISNGNLKEGERMPSIRTLARQLAINPNTVARAYRELEHLKIIISRRGSGFEVILGGKCSIEPLEKRFQIALNEAIVQLGPKKTLQLAKKAVLKATKKHARLK